MYFLNMQIQVIKLLNHKIFKNYKNNQIQSMKQNFGYF